MTLLAGNAIAQTYYWNRNAVLASDKDFTRAHNWTSNANGTGSYPTSASDDDFTSNALSSAWTLLDRDNSGSTAVNTTTNDNQLTMTVGGADIWGATNEFAALYRKDILGNFDVSVKVISRSGGNGWAKGGIMVALDFDDPAQGGYLILCVTPSHAVNLQWVADGAPNAGELDASSSETGTATLPKWLRLVKIGYNYFGYYKDAEGDAWTQVGNLTSPYWGELEAEVGIFANSQNGAGTATWVFDDWKGGTAISATGLTLSLSGSGSNADASAVVSSDVTAASINFTDYSGTLSFGGQNGLFATYYDNNDFTGTSVARVDSMVAFDWAAGSPDGAIGADTWSGSYEGYVVAPVTGTYTFYTDVDDGERLWVNHVRVVDDWYGTTTAEETGSPTVSLTAGVPVPIRMIIHENGGNADAYLRWQCSGCSPAVAKEVIPKRCLRAGRLAVTGDANLGSGTFTAADGALEFTGASGTQVFTPRASQTMPRIVHSGAGTLQLASNNLTTLGFYQSAGTLDFNGRTLTTAASGPSRGDFQVWNGTSSSFANLGGSTLTIVGNASFTGQQGNLVNLNPGSAWTLTVTGQLTADYASVGNCNASAGDSGRAYRSTDAGSNSKWRIHGNTFYWNTNDVITGSTNMNRSYNWTSFAGGFGWRPATAEDDKFPSTTLSSGWTFKDADNSQITGAYLLSGGQLVLSGRGADMYGAANEFVAVTRSDINGDWFDLTVKMTAQSNTDNWAKAGIVMANDLSNLGSGGYAYVAVTPAQGFTLQWDGATTAGQIDNSAEAGSVTFPCWLRLVRNGTTVTAFYKTSLGTAWTQIGGSITPQGLAGGTDSRIGLFLTSHDGGETGLAVFDDFHAGGEYFNGTDNVLSFNGTGASADGNANVNASFTCEGLDFTNYSGTFDFGAHTVTVANGGNATFSSTMGLTPGSGTLAFGAAWGVNSNFTPKPGATHPAITKSNANSVNVLTNGLIAPSLSMTGGTWNWGTGLTHSIGSLATSSSSNMWFNTSTVNVTSGNADFSGLTTVNANTGTLGFTGTSGTQVFTPKSGQTHPNVVHSGAATLQLAGSDLTALSFSQSAGTLDFNGRNLATVSSGNFTLTNGGAASFANLGGRILTVAGATSFTGQSGNLANLGPATAWTLAGTGAVTATYAHIANSTASLSGGVATHSVNGGGNVNWNLAAADFSSWTYKARISFNTTASGANVPGNVNNFPLLLRFDANNFIFTQAESDGSDLRFADPDGTSLYYQIERWDAAGKRGEVWVLANQVDGNSDRDYLTMYWGNSTAAAASNGPATFPVGAGFQAAWHFNGGSFADATSNGHTLTNGSTSTDTGVAGDGRAALEASLGMSNAASLNPTAAITLSAWVKPFSWAGGNRRILQKGATDNQYRLLFDGTNLRFHLSGLSSGGTLTHATLPSTGDWHLVTATYDGSASRLYYDGALVASQAASGSIAVTSDALEVAGKPSGLSTDRFYGHIDEVIVASSARSADWIKLAYETQKPRASAITYQNTALSTWSHSTKLYVNTTASGANISTDQADFPLLVRLSRANFNFDQAASDGSDLRFADSAGNLLAYEIERWDAAARLAEAWVLLPTVKGNNNSQWFRMYWGKAGAASLSSGAAVFNGSNHFVGNWHLKEASGGPQDATSFRNHASANGNIPNAVDGMVGKATSFDGNGDYGNAGGNRSMDVSANDKLTLSAWVKRSGNAAAGNWEGILTKLEWTGGDHRCYALTHYNGSEGFRFQLNPTGAGANDVLLSSNVQAANGTWYHLAAVADNVNAKIYVNGELKATQAYSAGIFGSTSADVRLGLTDDDGGANRQFFNGAIDEASIARVDRSADWIKLAYENQKAGSSVVAVGTRSPDYARSVQFNFNTTASGADVAGNVANIPILVRLTAANFDFTAVRDDAADLRFVDRDGSGLFHEVVEWDKGNRSGKVWVKVPQVDGNSTADYLTLYYGCSTCTGSPWAVPDSVWSGYASVYHLAAPETRAMDAAALGNHGNYGQSLPFGQGLTAKNALVFDGASNSYVEVPNESSYDFTTNVSVSAWVKVFAFTTAWQAIVAKGDNSFRLSRDNAGNAAYVAINVSGTKSVGGSVALNDGAWHHVVGTYDGSQVKLYVDGVQDGASTAASGAADLNNSPLYIGENSGAAGRMFNGSISEVRLSNQAGVLSADFIKLSYQNQKEGSLLLSNPVTATSFTSSRVFKFNTTASGANVAGDAYGFPLLLRLTDGALIDAVQMSGSNPKDIRFLDGDGVTWLDYQVERWDQGADKAEVWVKVPKVDGNSSADFITMYYNDVVDGSVPDAQCGSCVFEAGNGFRGAWHLNTSGTGARPNAVAGWSAATPANYDNDGHKAGGGLIAGADSLDGSNDYLDLGAGYADFTAGITYSAWAYPTAANNWARFMDFGSGAPTDNIVFARSGTGSTLGVGLYNNGSGGNVASGPVLTLNEWQHVAFSVDPAGTVRIYRNGVQVQSGSAPATLRNVSRSNNWFGRSHWGGDAYYVGKLDEPTLAAVARPADWIKLSYESQRESPTLFNPSPADFVSSRWYGFNTTKTGANVMGDVGDFPVLVRIAGSAIVDAVQNDFDDIRFLDADGRTWLQYQVERWDKTADSAEVWVLVPQVEGNSVRDGFTLYYDDAVNGAVPSGQCATCVFSSTTGFAGAWHLANSVADASGTWNGSDNASSDAGGIIGRGRAFNGSSSFIRVARPVQDDFSISFWMKGTTAGASGTHWHAGSGLVDAEVTGTVNDFGVTLNDKVAAFGTGNADVTLKTVAPDTLTQGDWNHVTATRSRSDGALKLYLNGRLKATGTGSTASLTAPGNIDFGRIQSGTRYFTGSLDEVQIASLARDSNWIRLAYESQKRSGNLFWNARPGPNNRSVLTASPGHGAISLTWSLPVSDSANADSVGLWLRYGITTLDSVGASAQSPVVRLPKTDSAYSFPATYPGTYTFALAVRNAAGQWSPFSAASTDTVVQSGDDGMLDTIYVDSAIGNNTDHDCDEARNPATPKATITGANSALACETGGIGDTLVIRVMRGSYPEYNIDPNAENVVVTSFDANSRAVLTGNGSLNDGGTRNATVFLRNDLTLRNMDVMCTNNNNIGVYVWSSDDRVRIEGCRIYNRDASTRHNVGIQLQGNGSNYNHVAANLIHQPVTYGILMNNDNSFNIVNNTLIGTGAGGSRGIHHAVSSGGYTDMTVTNNILCNWDYGISTTSADIGVVSNNLFHLVTSGREVTGENDANKLIRDPLFANMTVGDRNAFKLLPGSPAIEAGTSTYATGGESVGYRTWVDHFGTTRPHGAAMDIGLYEGSGHTPSPSGEFDSLTNVVSGNTVIVRNSKWKLVWDMARGGGIAGYHDMTGDTTANLVGSGSLLFDVRVDAKLASTETGNSIAPVFLERTRARSIVKQRLALSASLDLVVWYTVYASGHVHVQSEIINLSSGTLDVDAVQYHLKVGTAAAVAQSGSNLAGISYKNGFGYLSTAGKDPFLSVTQDLDAGAFGAAETWTQQGSVTGSVDSVGFATTDLTDLGQNMRRQHHFLLYVADGGLDLGKASALNADAWNPSPVTVSAGSLLHERSWQDRLGGHWTFDEGAGTQVRDRSINYTNHTSSLASTAWVAGKVGGALRFTTASVATVDDHAALEAAANRTYMLWVKPDFAAMGADAFILSKGTGTSDGWHFRRVSGQSKIKFVMANVEVQSPTLATGAWTHLAASVDGARTVTLWVNGVLAGAGSAAATASANSANLLFGKDGGGADAFAGDLDDVRIYHFNPNAGHLQAIVQRGYSQQYGLYHLRADNNNRVVARLNEGAAQTRVQPAFFIDNWFGASKTPKYVYLNGVRLFPNVDFTSDSLRNASSTWDFGNSLILQVNKVLTGADQTLFVDDDDSSGYMGESGKMKTLAVTATANDKIAIQNFSGSTFGSATSGQWALELDLNGWANAANNRVTDTGFGEFNSWKAAAVSPNLSLGSAVQLVGTHSQAGRSLASMKFRTSTGNLYSTGFGYGGPAHIAYSLVDSSATRLSLILDTAMISGTSANGSLIKRWTVYPTGRIFGSFRIITSDFAMTDPQLRLMTRYNSGPASAWAAATANSTARWGTLGGDLDFHSVAGGILSVKSAGAAVTSPGSLMGTSSTSSDNAGGADQNVRHLKLADALFEAADDPITVSFVVDISKDFTDSATADSLIKDLQTPATLTALGSGSTVSNDTLDFNGDGFAEGDGAYVYQASGSGVAHFRFVNTVTHFNPAFRIKSWSFPTLPEFVIVDNQTLTREYHFNAHLSTATSEVILQFNKTFKPGNHLFYIAHKTGLAVTLNRFEAVGGEGADTLRWATESEFENLGFNLWRRVSAAQPVPEGLLDEATPVAGAGIANALMEQAKAAAAAKRAADAGDDSLVENAWSEAQLEEMGYVRVNAKLIPGAKGGSSSTTSEYEHVDRTAAYGVAYEYLLEAVDFHGGRVQYGPREATPRNPLETALHLNYPNPFNPVTTLRFSLKEKAKVSLVVYDSRGRTVRTLIQPARPMLPGKYRLIWDARDDRGFEVPSGQYFYRFTVPGYHKTRKMILVK